MFLLSSSFIGVSSTEITTVENQMPTDIVIDGPTQGFILVKYSYFFGLVNSNRSLMFINIDWGDESYSGWLGPYNINEGVRLAHIWYEGGNYTISVIVFDGHDSWYAKLNVTIIENYSPDMPEIKGPRFVKPHVKHNYTFKAIDPEGDNISYEIRWGDNTSDKWIGAYISGEEMIRNHTYDKPGLYTIIARGKDTNDLIGPWGIFTILVPKAKQIINPIFFQFKERFPNAFPILRHILGL